PVGRVLNPHEMTAVVQAIGGKRNAGRKVEVLLQQLRIERLSEAIHAQSVAVELERVTGGRRVALGF
nr:hypothetical protein [Tanacetum cinerariifolium]